MASTFFADLKELTSSPPLWKIEISDLKHDDERFKSADQALRDYQQVSSYSWLGTPKSPQIVVPGAAKRFRLWEGGKLARDSDLLMADENHYMMPEFPMEPLFQAVKISVQDDERFESFKFQDCDVVTDRNNLRKLFGILLESSNRTQLAVESRGRRELHIRGRPVRIDIQRIGRLICLIRCQEEDKEKTNARYPTFGKDFENKCTISDNDYCVGSFRQIVTYKFGDLKLLVRFEVDSADYDQSKIVKPAKKDKKEEPEDKKEEPDAKKEPDAKTQDKGNPVPFDDLLEKLSLSDMKSHKLPDSKLSCLRYGQKYDYHLVELTTRRENGQFPDHVWPQMFFSGSESLVIGWHYFGNVKKVDRYSIQKVEKEYGGFPSENMSRFYYLLEKIVEFAREKDDEKLFSIIWKPEFGDEIHFYSLENPSQFAAPDVLKSFIAKN